MRSIAVTLSLLAIVFAGCTSETTEPEPSTEQLPTVETSSIEPKGCPPPRIITPCGPGHIWVCERAPLPTCPTNKICGCQ